ncbi:hypothetical protein FB639_004158, partial [Coemansia asiatica]
MGETVSFDASPELTGSVLENIPGSRIFEPSQSQAQLSNARLNQLANNGTSSGTGNGTRNGVSLTKSDDVDTIDLDSSSEEDYPDPSSFLAPRSSQMGSLSPELGSPLTGVAQNHQTFNHLSKVPKIADLQPADTEQIIAEFSNSSSSDINIKARARDHENELARILNAPGKRRRVENGKDEENDRDALPVTIDKSHNLIRADKVLRRLSDSSTFRALPVGIYQSASSARLRTPLSEGAKRYQIKVRPWSSSKRIRMSSGDSSDSVLNLEESNSAEAPPTTAVSLVHDPSNGEAENPWKDSDNNGIVASSDPSAILAPQSSQPSQPSHTLSAPALSNVSDLSNMAYVPQTPDDLGHVAVAENTAQEISSVSNDKALSTQSNHKNQVENGDNSQATDEDDYEDEGGDYKFVDASEEQSESLSQSQSQPESQSQSQVNDDSHLSPGNSEQQQQRQQSPFSKTISLSLRDSDEESDKQDSPVVGKKAKNQSVSARADADSSDTFECTDDSDASVTEAPAAAVISREQFSEDNDDDDDSDDSDKDEGEAEDVELEDEDKEQDSAAQMDKNANTDDNGSVESADKPESKDASASSSEPDTEEIPPSDLESVPEPAPAPAPAPAPEPAPEPEFGSESDVAN